MIFQNAPVLDGNERKYVLDCLDTGWISATGGYVDAFERKFSEYCGAAHGVACSSGTTAIHLALEALGIGCGDEVIVPCFTLIADANMVILAGARPVFVDVSPRNWCIDPAQTERKITPRTKAIVPVHMYGHPCDMDPILEIAWQHGLYVIEDAAQAHGAEYRGRRVGKIGDVGCFSFYASKTLTTGEGGMVVTNNARLAERMRTIRSQGFEGDSRAYIHKAMGFNYRLTNFQAAIGLAQTEKADEKTEKKREIARCYRRLLENEPDITLQAEESWAKSTFWNYTVLVEDGFGASRDEVRRRLYENGIETRCTFKALHRQPVYVEGSDPRYPDVGGHYPVSEALDAKGICLPSGLALTEFQISEVAEKLLQCRRGKSNQ